jgi:hypothetical protein
MMRVISLQRAPSADRMLFAATPPPAIALTMTMPHGSANINVAPVLPRRGARFIRRCGVWATLCARHCSIAPRPPRFDAHAHSAGDTQVGPQQAEIVHETETFAGIAAI